jgi:hypothetical protein
MKKLIRSRSLYLDETPKAVQTAPPCTVDRPTVRPVRAHQPKRYMPVNPGDDHYTEAYERECIQLESAQPPELAPSVPVVTSESAEAPYTQARVVEGPERDAIIRRYRTHDRRSMLALIPLHTPSSWVIFEHADGNHTCANLDW